MTKQPFNINSVLEEFDKHFPELEDDKMEITKLKQWFTSQLHKAFDEIGPKHTFPKDPRWKENVVPLELKENKPSQEYIDFYISLGRSGAIDKLNENKSNFFK